MSQDLHTSFENLFLQSAENSNALPEETLSNHQLPISTQDRNQAPKILSKQSSLVSQVSNSEEENQVTAQRKKGFAQKTKRSDCAGHENLKKVKKTEGSGCPCDCDSQEAPKVKLAFTTYRRYSETAKASAVGLAKTIGVARASMHSGIPETSIRRWQKSGLSRTGKSGRIPLFPEIEAELLKVFKDFRHNGILQTNKSLQLEARRIAQRLKNNDFVGTGSWLQGFKKRNGICYRRGTKVGQRIPQDAEERIQEFKSQIVKLFEEHKYHLEAVVNADETGLCFDALSHSTLEFKVFYYSFINV